MGLLEVATEILGACKVDSGGAAHLRRATASQAVEPDCGFQKVLSPVIPGRFLMGDVRAQSSDFRAAASSTFNSAHRLCPLRARANISSMIFMSFSVFRISALIRRKSLTLAPDKSVCGMFDGTHRLR